MYNLIHETSYSSVIDGYFGHDRTVHPPWLNIIKCLTFLNCQCICVYGGPLGAISVWIKYRVSKNIYWSWCACRFEVQIWYWSIKKCMSYEVLKTKDELCWMITKESLNGSLWNVDQCCAIRGLGVIFSLRFRITGTFKKILFSVIGARGMGWQTPSHFVLNVFFVL